MAAQTYTSCVEPADYRDLDLTPQIVTAALGVLVSGTTFGLSLVASTQALLSALEEVLDYMLEGKLICLGGDRCAVGTIAQFETIDEKSFPDSVDNDFSINLMLWPFSVGAFVGKSFTQSSQAVEAGDQGVLVKPDPSFGDAQKGREASDISAYQPAKCQLTPQEVSLLDPSLHPSGDTDVPVLHCECEGSRINDLHAWLEDLGSFGAGSAVCDWSPLGIPVGAAVCTLVETILLPVTAAGLAVAWFAASDGNPDDARLDPQGGALWRGDIIVVTGRWSYDAGHTGWNELHPVETIQRVDPEALVDDLAERWCGLVSGTPPKGVDQQEMTADQASTWAAQQQPANQWEFHPAVDGCRGSIPSSESWTHRDRANPRLEEDE